MKYNTKISLLVIIGAILGIIVQRWKKDFTSIINLGKGE